MDDFWVWAMRTYPGSDRHWIRRNEPALRQAFQRGTNPRPVLPSPPPAPRYDRYSELD
ncbi:hypothetical protein [Sphingobium indicum]|uniref:hypothetical protein n=1 Tax=Sphingobium indicum TaxID=332055 RepID=UPI00031DCBE7|nr:hypothetical protein [Sphingobium indicum]